MAHLKVTLFGLPQFFRDNEIIHLERRKATALLAYLIMTRKPHSRDALAAMYWPEYDQSAARANLRRELSRLKMDLGDDVLLIEREHVQLHPGLDLQLDVTQFQERLHRLREDNHQLIPTGSSLCEDCRVALSEAVGLYNGDFMSGFNLLDSPAFDEWQFFQAEGLRQMLAEALQHLIWWYSDHGDFEPAVAYARRWLALDPLNEPAHQELMRLYAWSGKHSAAIRQYQECVRLLKEELGVQPDEETTALFEAIRTKQLEPPRQKTTVRSSPKLITTAAIQEKTSLSAPGSSRSFIDQAKSVVRSTELQEPLEQHIGYTTSPDRVKIAYATVGEGPVLVKTANWLSHLEFDWNSPVWKHWLNSLTQGHTLIRYDERGCGLSDWNPEELSLDAFVRDLETVVDSLGLERFPLLGISQGGPVSIAYTVRHPERVSRLILYGTYARGRMKRKYSEREVEMGEVILSMMKLGWGKDNPAFRQFFTTLFMPEASAEQMQWFNDLQKISTSPEMAIRLENTFFHLDVSDIVPELTVPTLVVHSHDDGIVPYQEGRWLAERIPDARFVTLDSKNHILLESDPSWELFLKALRTFLQEDDRQKSLDVPVTPVQPAMTVSYHKTPTHVDKNMSTIPLEVTTEVQITEKSNMRWAIPLNNLPRQLTPFIGRESEMKEITSLLADDPECRLLTITGPGGMGKTRLALEVASRLLEQFPDGVWNVPLQTVNAAEFIVPAIADAVQFYPSGGEDPGQQLLTHLENKSLLLLLDNIEHVLEGADIVQSILEACQQVKVLVTSRQVLNLRGEWLYPLDGLPIPLDSDKNDLNRYSSVELFLERARRARIDFSLEDEWLGVVQICQSIEGLPLAIELAASWTRILSTSQIANEIRQNLNFLETSYADMPERHRSMQAVFDQSWSQLTRGEQSVFKRLSVFRGGFKWRAAQQVTAASLPVLTALADKSLLHIDTDGRYHIHELLRQYAEERLSDSPEEVSHAYDLHSDFFGDYVHQRLLDLMGGEQLDRLEEIKDELDNIRMAWRWSLQKSCFANVRKILQGLNIYFQYQSRFAEGLQVFESAVASLDGTTGEEEDSLIAELLVCMAWLQIRLGQFQKAEAGFSKALDIYTRSNEMIEMPLGLATDPVSGLAIVAGLHGQYQRAVELGERALSDSSDREGHRNESFAHYVLTSAYLALGEYQRALENAEAAYRLAKEYESLWFMAYCLNEWGNVARAMGRYAEARQRFLESYSIRESFNDPEGMAVALNHLGRVAILEGDFLEAKALYQNALKIYQDLNDRGGYAASLSGLGSVALGLGDYSRARQNYREALQISTEIGFEPQTLSILMDVSDLYITTGFVEKGVELLSLVKTYPGSGYETRRQAEERLRQLEGQSVQGRWSVAAKRGEGLDPDALSKILIQEL